jgi:glycosyltransferase involved in cell wall biosynthesis
MSPVSKSHRLSSLTVVLPCYNEEANVERVVRAASAACHDVADDYEVLVVNDGSADGTGVLADRMAEQLAGVRAVHHPENRGYGRALRSGFVAARMDWVFFKDGDGQFDMDELGELPPMLERCDIVCGYRRVRRDPWLRRLNGRAWTLLVWLYFGVRVRDLNCAFKLLPRSLFDQISLKSTGALINAELLARAQARGFRIGQIGVSHYPRTAGTQTGANPGVILRAFIELFRLWKDIQREHH